MWRDSAIIFGDQFSTQLK